MLVTGASGYLAQTLIPRASTRAQVHGAARSPDGIVEPAEAHAIDLDHESDVFTLFKSIKPDVVIHCAACNPGSDAASMYAVNTRGSEHVAKACTMIGARLVALSSDTVFDGKSAPYSDDAPAAPLNANDYALSKAQGELAILKQCPAALIVRTSLIYDVDEMDRGTLGFVERLYSGERLKLFDDVIRQPVYAPKLSEHLCSLAMDHVDQSGIMNLVGSEAMSRYTFGLKMLDFWGIDYENRIDKVSAAGIPGVPLDLNMLMNRANKLALDSPGVTAVLRLANPTA